MAALNCWRSSGVVSAPCCSQIRVRSSSRCGRWLEHERRVFLWSNGREDRKNLLRISFSHGAMEERTAQTTQLWTRSFDEEDGQCALDDGGFLESAVPEQAEEEEEEWQKNYDLGNGARSPVSGAEVSEAGGGGGDGDEAPLLEALKACAAQDVAAFHFPGHRRGRGAPSLLRETLGMSVFAHDLPELPELDNLFAPEGAIARAQDKAALLFRADATYFLVNGSTCGIQAAVMATCQPGDFVILPRNCHLSAVSAMVLSGALPAYVMPIFDSKWGIAAGVSAQSIASAIGQVREAGGRVGAVLVVSPTYHGICSSIADIAHVCRENELPLIVDEAHGAHFPFHESLPRSALEQGADIAVQSTHKVLGSLTQSSMLHVRGERVSRDVLGRCLQMVQSSSPSYLLLSSLDAARAQMSGGGVSNPCIGAALALAVRARRLLKAVPGLTILDGETIARAEELAGFDPLRLTVGLWGLCIDGYEADDVLRLEYGVIAELPAIQTLTFAISAGTSASDIDRLVEACRALSARFAKSDADVEHSSRFLDTFHFSWISPSSPGNEMSPRDAFFSETQRVGIENATGHICAELLCPYPPGIPVITPGEVITQSALAYLRSIILRGGTISGASDPSLATICICQR